MSNTRISQLLNPICRVYFLLVSATLSISVTFHPNVFTVIAIEPQRTCTNYAVLQLCAYSNKKEVSTSSSMSVNYFGCSPHKYHLNLNECQSEQWQNINKLTRARVCAFSR